jgi:MEDS: MEthanogen/methylotroph, DcmR Sensory domain
MHDSEAPIRFAGAQLVRNRHVCAFFRDSDEEYGVMLPFIKDGFERGDRAFHIVDPVLRADHLRRLRSAGIDVEAEERRGALELRDWQDAYLREGHFDQDRMLALIEEILDQGPRKGFHLTRLVAHMEWALEDRPGVDDLVEYEARLNYVLPRYKDPVV